MNKIDERYKNGQIYSIRSPQTEMVYYGSTITTLTKRFYFHNYEFNNQGKYCSSHEILKLGNAYIEWVEDYPCNSKKELNRREGQVQRANKAHCVNLYVAGQTTQEYYEENKEAITAQHKNYYEVNKEAILDKQKLYQNKNKEALSVYRKEYYVKNKKLLLDYQKSYNAKKKQIISSANSVSSLTSLLPNQPASPSHSS